MEDGYTEAHVILQTYLIEPQGIVKRMRDEPYRWIEAIQDRRDYIEDQLRVGSPVVGLTYNEGMVLLTIGRGQRKIFEVHDRICTLRNRTPLPILNGFGCLLPIPPASKAFRTPPKT